MDGRKGDVTDQPVPTGREVARFKDAVAPARLRRQASRCLRVCSCASLPEPEHATAWDEVEEALGEFEGPDGFVGPCELLVAAATAS